MYNVEAVVQKCYVKKVFLEILRNSQESTWCQSPFFNKVVGLNPATLLKKRLWHRCFLVNFCEFLKELRNYKRKLFCIRHKNRRKHNQHFKTAVFHNKFTRPHIKPNINNQETKFASLKQYLFRLLTSRNAKKTQTDQSMPRVFLLCLKRNDPQTFKSGSCKQSFLKCVCYWYNLLR